MTRKFRVNQVDSSWEDHVEELDKYVGEVLELLQEFDLTARLYTPDRDTFWDFKKSWLTEVFEEDKGPKFKSITIETKQEQVHSPKHYNVLEDIEAIQIIASSMTQEMFKGYCLGNILKYRLRCGAKDDVSQELAKADKYKELFAKYKYLCKEQQ